MTEYGGGASFTNGPRSQNHPNAARAAKKPDKQEPRNPHANPRPPRGGSSSSLGVPSSTAQHATQSARSSPRLQSQRSTISPSTVEPINPHRPLAPSTSFGRVQHVSDAGQGAKYRKQQAPLKPRTLLSPIKSSRSSLVRCVPRFCGCGSGDGVVVAVVTVMIYVIHCIMRNNEAPSNV